MKIFVLLTVLLTTVTAFGQSIQVRPTGVNVNSQNATTVFLTFGQIPNGYVPAEAVWCGELVPAVLPAQGLQCLPNTIYGALPARYNLSQSSGNLGFTDIMSIPPSIVRRAYQAAVRGANAGFFYVRRFVSTNGQSDQYVNVTCRMTSGGARVPFALTDVQFVTDSKEPIIFLQSGETLSAVSVDIKYNGTGRLKGRWEIVLPGEEQPSDNDLLTEATLPIEDRTNQKRFTQVERFNYFLPPTGKFTMKLEHPERIPLVAQGQYLLLLRVEAVNDKEGDSELDILGVGNDTVHSGAVAGFPLPTLKFFVGGDPATNWADTALITAAENPIRVNQAFIFSWKNLPNATFYKLDIIEKNGDTVFSAVTKSNIYRSPSWFAERFKEKKMSWKIIAFDKDGQILGTAKPVGIVFK